MYIMSKNSLFRPGDTFRMQQMQNPAEKAKMDSEVRTSNHKDKSL